MTRDIRKRDRRDNNHFSSNQRKVVVRSVGEELEAKLGFDLFNEGDKRLCWLLTFASDGSSFKAKYKFRPYFYVATKDKMEIDVKAYLRRRYENDIIEIEIVDKEDLDLVIPKSYIVISRRRISCWMITLKLRLQALDLPSFLSTLILMYPLESWELSEYASSGKLTDKSDVFSFGFVLLELITGCRPVNKAHPFADDSMVEWVRPLLAQALESRSFDVLVDPRLHEYDSSEMATMIACAAACVRHSARLRPQMSQGLFETACDYAREHGGLLWEESKKMRLVVKTEVHVHMREHIHQQKY